MNYAEIHNLKTFRSVDHKQQLTIFQLQRPDKLQIQPTFFCLAIINHHALNILVVVAIFKNGGWWMVEIPYYQQFHIP